MKRRAFLSAGFAASLRAARRERPNIVFILSDDHHYQCLGSAGNPHIHTPQLDRFAAAGVNFGNAIVSTSQCAPSRGVLLSGLECFQNGLRSNGALSFRFGLGPAVPLQLQRAGYDTALIGKWHIGSHPRDSGFASAPLWLQGGGSRYVDPELRAGFDAPAGTVQGHITELFTDAAETYLRSAGTPFFLWLAYNAPHTPWQAPPQYQKPYAGKDWREIAPPAHPKDAGRFDWPAYYSVITHLDAAAGRVVRTLHDTGLWENTVVFFLGDNGYMCKSKGLDGKVVHWEESVRVPLLAAGGPVRARGKLEHCAASIDLPATWLNLAGVKPQYRLSGRTLLPLLRGGKAALDEAFCAWDDGRPEALLPPRAVEPYRLIRTRTHKLVAWQSGKRALYDLARDPQETRDVAAEQTRIAGDLGRRLALRMAETGDLARHWPSA